MKIIKYSFTIFATFLLLVACKSRKEAEIRPFEEAILGNFNAIPDLKDMKADLNKANLGQEDIENLFPKSIYTFNTNGDYIMTRTGLGLDKVEKGRWTIKDEELKLVHLKGSYRYRLSWTAEGLIYLNDDITGESMDFTLAPIEEEE